MMQSLTGTGTLALVTHVLWECERERFSAIRGLADVQVRVVLIRFLSLVVLGV